jgi:ubiquitin carboxyl-terminal hydrolase 34
MEVLEPHLLAEFLEEKVWNLIKDMKRPKDWKFVPSDNQKSVISSSQNYVGIVNLGCVCYMNSMMQQFFMVPQFRYQLLRAIDNSPIDLKEYKGFMINDNLLLQL